VILAFLCSGQGDQHRGMFDLSADCPDAAPIFATAAELLGRDPRLFVREADETALFSNRAGQILCCTQALALWAALGADRPQRAVIAGYSVGELASWGCAGALDAAATLRLAQHRAQAMDEAAAALPSPGGLAAILGLREQVLSPLLQRHGGAISIVNDVDSFVVGGSIAALDAVCEEAMRTGATRVVRLRVAVPAHTVLLEAAELPFRVALAAANPRLPAPGMQLLSGLDGDAVRDPGCGSEALSRQIRARIDWAGCLTACREAGTSHALELGPGRALSRMADRVFPPGNSRSADDFRTLSGLRSWLSRATA
jgi:[acyl-carrier-protein] S-malonyltransferase